MKTIKLTEEEFKIVRHAVRLHAKYPQGVKEGGTQHAARWAVSKKIDNQR